MLFDFVLCGSIPLPPVAEIGKASPCYAQREDILRERKGGGRQAFRCISWGGGGVIVESSPMSQEEAVKHVENYLKITYKVKYSQYCTCLPVTLIFNFDREVVFTVLGNAEANLE
jgi:hypothetical protein